MRVLFGKQFGVLCPRCLRLQNERYVVMFFAQHQVVFVVPCLNVCVVNNNQRNTVDSSLLCLLLTELMSRLQLIYTELVPVGVRGIGV